MRQSETDWADERLRRPEVVEKEQAIVKTERSALTGVDEMKQGNEGMGRKRRMAPVVSRAWIEYGATQPVAAVMR